jgi:CRISPR-associated protein Csy1
MNTTMINEEITEQLSKKIIGYIYSRRDKKEEEFLKAKAKKNKQGEITNGAINIQLLNIVKKLSDDTKTITIIEKAKKTREQTALAFQQDKYKQLMALIADDVIDGRLHTIKTKYQDFVLANNNEHAPVTWLNQWVVKAKDISFATHVGKLTHSSSKSSSILDTTVEINNSYLTTNSLDSLEVDTAATNAASLPIADVLKLTVNGISVLDCLKQGDKSLFQKLTNDDALIDEWGNQLKQAYDSTQKQSYFLSKQIYFPTQKGQYHLLLPLASSSLIHVLHLEHKNYWEDEQVIARKQKSAKMYSPAITCTYPNKALLSITSNIKAHSNVSPLNKERLGKVSLLSATPPQWRSRLASYIERATVFDKALAFELREEINELKNYLLLIKNKSLSISEPKRNAAVMNKLQTISSQLFNYVETINNNETMVGWTIESKLSIEQQLMFEPWREDEAVKALKINNQWQKTLSKTYGRWLNQQLTQKSHLTPTTIHAALWADCFLLELREMVATQEVAL